MNVFRGTDPAEGSLDGDLGSVSDDWRDSRGDLRWVDSDSDGARGSLGAGRDPGTASDGDLSLSPPNIDRLRWPRRLEVRFPSMAQND